MQTDTYPENQRLCVLLPKRLAWATLNRNLFVRFEFPTCCTPNGAAVGWESHWLAKP